MKTRIISGVVGVLLLILAIIFRSTIVFNIAFGLLTVIGVIEAQVTTKLVKNNSFVILSCIYAFVCAFFPVFGFMPLGLLFTAIYIFACIVLTLFENNKINVFEPLYSVAMTLFISFGISSVIYISNLDVSKSFMYNKCDSLFLLLLAFGGAWFGDTGAYFIGSKYGKHKISPTISPKKSLEGVIGSIISTVLCMLILGFIWNVAVLDKNSYIQFGWLILVSAICPLIGLAGDLFFSFIKRKCDLKDYGKIMPGHGGVLDRFDSVILVAPFIYLVVMYLPIIVNG